MAPKIPSAVLREIPHFAQMMVKKSVSRLTGKMLIGSKQWREALEHIADHFRPIAGKPTHTVFVSKYANNQGVSDLISRALNSLGRQPIVSRLTVAGKSVGKPCVIMEKEFSEVIGKSEKGGDCKILRIIMDFTGRPITAYPVKEFFGASAIVVTLATSSEAQVPMVKVVQDVYMDEAETHYLRYSLILKERQSTMGEIIDFIFPLPVEALGLDPQEVAPEKFVRERARKAIIKIETSLGGKLDEETKENIIIDILSIWGWYYA